MSARNGRQKHGGKKKKRGGGGRQRALDAEQRRQARAEQVFDPATSPVRAAALLREEYGDQPLEPAIAVTIAARGDLARARAVAGAALAQEAGPMALSLAADVALMDGRPDEAEGHAARALGLSDDPDLHLRLAVARANQGRLAEGIGVLDEVLVENPGLEELQLARGELLARLAAQDAGSGEDRSALRRFRDRGALLQLQEAVAAFSRSSPAREEAFAAGLAQWVEAGAVSGEELQAWAEAAAAGPFAREASLVRLMGEWAWLAPDADGDSSLLEAFATDPATAPELARRAEDVLSLALWGLWELGDPSGAPGVRLTELLSGARVYAEVPPELVGDLPRWSVLVGYVAPVDGIWRAGSGFVTAGPLEGREVAHELLDGLLEVLPDQVEGADEHIRALLRWAEGVHGELDLLRLPAEATMPSPPAFAAYQAMVRTLAPGLAGMVRQLQGTAPEQAPQEVVRAELDVPDPVAALEALEEVSGFVRFEDEDDLTWGSEEDDWPRGSVRLDEGRLVAHVESDEDLEELVALLGRPGQPVTVRSREVVAVEPVDIELDPDDEEEGLEEAVAVPDLGAAELPGWLLGWAQLPLDVLDGRTPLEALKRDPTPVEVLVRCLEHELDVRGLREVDTTALRERLGLEEEA